MKKIILSAYACSPHKGSEYCVGWSWAVGLALKGFEVWCVTNIEDYEDCEKERIRLKLYNLHFKPVRLPSLIDKYWLDNNKKVIYGHYYWWKRRASKVVRELNEVHKFDIAQHVSYGSFQQGSSLYKLDNCKVIFGPVGGGQMSLPIFKPYFGSSWRIEKIRKFVSGYLVRYGTALNETLKRADVVLTVNKETEELLKTSKFYKVGSCFNISDSALPVQFENNEYINRVPKDELRILWVGRLLPRRGIELSLKALSFLPKEMKYKFVIIGDGEQGENIPDWISKYNLNVDKIEHLGWIPYAQMHEEYRKADVMLFCPLRDTAGLQATEAMGFSLPIITMNISGMRTIVSHECGVKIDPTTTEGTPKDIAKAIEKLYNDIEFRQKAAKAAYKRAMKYTWEYKINEVVSRFY